MTLKLSKYPIAAGKRIVTSRRDEFREIRDYISNRVSMNEAASAWRTQVNTRVGRDPEPRINIQIYVTINVP